MKLYFTDGQVPEIAALSEWHRRKVRAGAFDLFCQKYPSARWQARLLNGLAVLSGGAAGIFAGSYFAGGHRLLMQVTVAVFTTFIIAIVFQSRLTGRLRPYFGQYIETHRDEMEKQSRY